MEQRLDEDVERVSSQISETTMEIELCTTDGSDATRVAVTPEDVIGEVVERVMDPNRSWSGFSVMLGGGYELDPAATFNEFGIEDGARITVAYRTAPRIEVKTDCKSHSGESLAGVYSYLGEEHNGRPLFGKGDMRIYYSLGGGRRYHNCGKWWVTNTYTDIPKDRGNGMGNIYSEEAGAPLPFGLKWKIRIAGAQHGGHTWSLDHQTDLVPANPVTSICLLSGTESDRDAVVSTSGEILAGDYELLEETHNGKPLYGKGDMRVYYSKSRRWWVTNAASDLALDRGNGMGNIYEATESQAEAPYAGQSNGWRVLEQPGGNWQTRSWREVIILPGEVWKGLAMSSYMARCMENPLESDDGGTDDDY